jgi:hypothetical protein
MVRPRMEGWSVRQTELNDCQRNREIEMLDLFIGAFVLAFLASVTALMITNNVDYNTAQRVSLAIGCGSLAVAVVSFLCFYRATSAANALKDSQGAVEPQKESEIRQARGGEGGNAEAESGGIAAGGAGGPGGTFGEGGRGGSARAKDSGSIAFGGPGGRGGVIPGGPGGDAAAERGALYAGGEGGEAPQPDGRGGRGGRPDFAALGLPSIRLPDGRLAGEGGRGANAPVYDGKMATINKLHREYLQLHPQEKSTNAGIEATPVDWINHRLEQMKTKWRVKITDGEYEFVSIVATADKAK